MALLLDILGWKRVDHETDEIMRSEKRMILVYNHTSVLDYFFYVLYRNAYPDLKTRAKVIMNYYIYHSMGPIARPFGGIPSTPVYSGGQGTLDKVYQELSKMDEFIYMVSPKGSTRANAHWHKGYYILAQKLNCPIMVAGFDFERKQFVAKKPFYIGDDSFDEVTMKCQKQLEDIIPICPWRSEYPLEKYDLDNPIRAVEVQYFILFLCFVLLVFVLLFLLIWCIIKIFTWSTNYSG